MRNYPSGEVTAPNILTRLLRLSQLTGGFIGNDETAAVEQISAGQSSPLWRIFWTARQQRVKAGYLARFIPEIRAICGLLKKRGLRYCYITGEVKNREEQVSAFQNDPGSDGLSWARLPRRLGYPNGGLNQVFLFA